MGLTACVVGIHLRNLEKDQREMTHLVEMHVSSVSEMIHVTSSEYKQNDLTFIYSVYCSRAHLPLVIGSSLIPQGLPQPCSLGRNTEDLVCRRLVLLQKARKQAKARKGDQSAHAMAWFSAM